MTTERRFDRAGSYTVYTHREKGQAWSTEETLFSNDPRPTDYGPSLKEEIAEYERLSGRKADAKTRVEIYRMTRG